MRWGAAVHALSGTHAVLVCVVPNGTGGYKVVSAALAAGGTKWVALPDVPSSLTGSYVAYFSDYPWQGAYLDGVTALPAGRAVFSASGQVGVRHLE